MVLYKYSFFPFPLLKNIFPGLSDFLHVLLLCLLRLIIVHGNLRFVLLCD